MSHLYDPICENELFKVHTHNLVMKTHTTPTEVKAATMLIRVGIMLNFPAFKEKM